MFSSLFSKAPTMEWEQLSVKDQLEELDKKSFERPVLIFKHSTRCSISAMALSRFERNYKTESGFDPYMLDLIANREVSNEVSTKYNITHQSPQVVLIQNGKAIYDASHNAIDYNEIENSIIN